MIGRDSPKLLGKLSSRSSNLEKVGSNHSSAQCSLHHWIVILYTFESSDDPTHSHTSTVHASTSTWSLRRFRLAAVVFMKLDSTVYHVQYPTKKTPKSGSRMAWFPTFPSFWGPKKDPKRMVPALGSLGQLNKCLSKGCHLGFEEVSRSMIDLRISRAFSLNLFRKKAVYLLRDSPTFNP